jgi:hypothetical protein
MEGERESEERMKQPTTKNRQAKITFIHCTAGSTKCKAPLIK